jgi:ABC-type transport system involved in Fe-S cluster assembly fused permease/ATPase subunit
MKVVGGPGGPQLGVSELKEKFENETIITIEHRLNTIIDTHILTFSILEMKIIL